MDLEAVKAASTTDLVRCAIGAAVNAQGMLEDAEVLSAAGRHARSYALAALAVEEAGKSASLTALAVMPRSLRAQAPLGRMLEWHQLKLVGGLLVTAVPFGDRTMATRVAAMPQCQVEGMVKDAQVLAEDVDRLKQRGLYADIDRSGQVRLPSEVTEADVAALLGRARLAVSAVSVLLVPGTEAQLSNPPGEAVEFCRAMVSASAEAGSGRTPQAAADVMLNAIRKHQEPAAASDAWTSSPISEAADHRRRDANRVTDGRSEFNRPTACHPACVDAAALAADRSIILSGGTEGTVCVRHAPDLPPPTACVLVIAAPSRALAAISPPYPRSTGAGSRPSPQRTRPIQQPDRSARRSIVWSDAARCPSGAACVAPRKQHPGAGGILPLIRPAI